MIITLTYLLSLSPPSPKIHSMSRANFNALISQLTILLQCKKFNRVSNLLKSYHSINSEWNKYSIENSNINCDYTRNNLFELPNNLGQILILIWKPNCNSKIHNHPNSNCWVKLLEGKLEENIFNKDCKKKIATNLLSKNDVTFINDSIGLHSVHNKSSTDTAISLHVYSNNNDIKSIKNIGNIHGIYKNFQEIIDLQIKSGK